MYLFAFWYVLDVLICVLISACMLLFLCEIKYEYKGNFWVTESYKKSQFSDLVEDYMELTDTY